MPPLIVNKLMRKAVKGVVTQQDKCKEVNPVVVNGVKRNAVIAEVTQQDRCKKVKPLVVLRVKGRVGHHHQVKLMILFCLGSGQSHDCPDFQLYITLKEKVVSDVNCCRTADGIYQSFLTGDIITIHDGKDCILFEVSCH